MNIFIQDCCISFKEKTAINAGSVLKNDKLTFALSRMILLKTDCSRLIPAHLFFLTLQHQILTNARARDTTVTETQNAATRLGPTAAAVQLVIRATVQTVLVSWFRKL